MFLTFPPCFNHTNPWISLYLHSCANAALLQCPLLPLALRASWKNQGSTGPAHHVTVPCRVCLPELLFLQDCSARGSAASSPWEHSPPVCVSAFTLGSCHCAFVKNDTFLLETFLFSLKLGEGSHTIACSGRKVIFAATKQNTPSKCSKQREPGHLACPRKL